MKIQKETIVIGEENTLIKRDWRKWTKNTLLFLIPLVVLYLTSIVGLLNQTDRKFELVDLIPNQMMWGAIALYVLNSLQDLYLKWSQETKYVGGENK